MKFILISILMTAISISAIAQIPTSNVPLYYEPSIPAMIEAMPRGLPRAKGPALGYSLELAQAAVDACKARDKSVSARVADSVGTTVVLLSGDGAGERSQLITQIKALEAARPEASEDSDNPAQEIYRNPDMGSSLRLMDGAVFLGVFAVSGAPGLDETCAMEALQKFPVNSTASQS